MQNFVYCNPTELVFGRGAHKEIGMRMLPWAKDGKKALVIYGGGSAKRSGVLDDVVAGCEAAGLTVVVKGGVKPNPEMDFVREVTAFARAAGPFAQGAFRKARICRFSAAIEVSGGDGGSTL